MAWQDSGGASGSEMTSQQSPADAGDEGKAELLHYRVLYICVLWLGRILLVQLKHLAGFGGR
jgi:hypothetical protein